MKAEDEKLVDAVSGELYERLGDAPIFSLPWVAQVVTIVLAAHKYIDNGGFIYFFEGIILVIHPTQFSQMRSALLERMSQPNA